MNVVHCLKCLKYMLLESVKLGVGRNDQELRAKCEMFVLHTMPRQSAQCRTRYRNVINASWKVSNP